jgi:hypothetical protein
MIQTMSSGAFREIFELKGDSMREQGPQDLSGSTPRYGLGQVLLNDQMVASDWTVSDVSVTLGDPMFLGMIESMCSGRGQKGIYLLGQDDDPANRDLVMLCFPPNEAVTLTQVLDNPELWPRGALLITAIGNDGAARGIRRDAEGAFHRVSEKPVVFEGMLIPIRDAVDLTGAALAYLGFLGDDFASVEAKLLPAIAAKKPGRPLLVVNASPGRLSEIDGITLPERPVALSFENAAGFELLQKLGRAARWRVGGIFLALVDGATHSVPRWPESPGTDA